MLCEFGGRMCYNSFGDNQKTIGTEKYLNNIMHQGHGSVLEHANFSFLLLQTSRGTTHQMIRHRAGFAYSQESTHFIKYGIDIEHCIPKEVYDINRKLIDATLKASEYLYSRIYQSIKSTGSELEQIRDKKLSLGFARSMLTISLQSRMVFTANIRSLRHFIEQRCNKFNVPEIRMVAAEVLKIMWKESTCFDDIEFQTIDDRLPHVITGYRKV